MTTEQITSEERDRRLLAFADKHGLTLVRRGTCGFARPCVGLTKGRGYVDFHPLNMTTFDPIEGFDDEDDRLYPPDGVDNYGKHNCLAVLADPCNPEAALHQLLMWIEHLERQGEVEVVAYNNGARGPQAVFSGTQGHAIRFKADASSK